MGNVVKEVIVKPAEGMANGVASAGCYVGGAACHAVGQGDAGNACFGAGKKTGTVFVKQAPIVKKVTAVVEAFAISSDDESDGIAAFVDADDDYADDDNYSDDAFCDDDEKQHCSLNIDDDELRKQVQGCVDKLCVAQQDVVRVQQATDANQVISICDQMETSMRSMEQRAAEIVVCFNTKKTELDNELEANRQKYADVQAEISRKEDEVRQTESRLAAEEERLRGHKRHITELAADIKSKRREKRAKKKKAALTNIAMPSGWEFIAEQEIHAVQGQINECKNWIHDARSKIQMTRTAKRAIKKQVHRLKRQQSRLQDRKVMLNQVQKQLGQQIVSVSNASKNLQGAAMKCKHIRNKVESVRELTSEGLMEIIADPVNELMSNIQGARNDLSLCYLQK